MGDPLKIALYHNLPSGGALRVLSEYVRLRRQEHDFELFVPASASDFFGIGGSIPTHRIGMPSGTGLLADYKKLRSAPRFGREAAKRIDAGGFDAVLATASFLTQAPEVLPYLKTPSLYFCPEPLRGVYEKEREPLPLAPKAAAKRTIRAAYDRRRARFDRRAIRAADAVTVNSKYTQRNVRNVYGVGSSVVRHGVDAKAFRPGRKAKPPFVLSVGALHPLKGHQFV
ncbi:MAG: glycosyltransferase, partial [Patescibacteria group bacterium]|nr:glycosyltransferase [Patescibacteria group bacterium]